MFQIGDKVVHPLHGASVIEDIVERVIDGNTAVYYVLKPAMDATQLFLPVESSEKLGLRPVCTREQAEELLRRLADVACGEDKNWNQRYRENMLHIRSGDLLEVAQVVKSLAARDSERGLSTGEKKMLSSARQILDSEIAYALDIPPQQAAQLINERLCIK